MRVVAHSPRCPRVGLHQCPSEKIRPREPACGQPILSHVPTYAQSPAKRGTFRARPPCALQRRTRPWSKRDSNSRSHLRACGSFTRQRRGRHVEAVMRLGRDRVAGESRARRFRGSVPRSAACRPMRRLPRGPDQISLPDKQAGIAQAVDSEFHRLSRNGPFCPEAVHRGIAVCPDFDCLRGLYLT